MLLAGVAVCSILAAGCSGGGYPVSVEISVPIASAYSVEGYGDANPGDVLTPETQIPSVPMCTLPDRDHIDEMVKDAVGGFVAGMLDLERLDLLEITIHATESDFNTVDWLSLSYEPKPILSVEQPAVELGEATSESGLGTTIALQPPESVDFLDLIEDNEANPTPGCPQLEVRMSGTVPVDTPRWDVTVKLRVTGHISI